jgi:AcrR family transcriptional regulator
MTRVSKRRAKRDDFREAIVSSATNLFLQKGYEGTSISHICSALKISRPTLYYYMRSKGQLLYEVHSRGMERTLRPYMAEVKTINDPMVRLSSMLRGFTGLICSNPALRFLLHGSFIAKDRRSKQIRQEWKSHYELLRDTIGELCSEGIVEKDICPSQAALLLLGMMAWITFWFDYGRSSSKRAMDGPAIARKEGESRIDEIAALVEKIALQGLARRER